jgi:hypothetical protein
MMIMLWLKASDLAEYISAFRQEKLLPSVLNHVILPGTTEPYYTIFVHFSKKLQKEKYPTMNYAILQYLWLLYKLELLRIYFKANTTLGQACTSVYIKLDKYYKMIKKQNFAVVATVCDLWFNFNVFQNLYKESFNTNIHKIWIQKQFTETFIKY